jgi:hypothetical protein
MTPSDFPSPVARLLADDPDPETGETVESAVRRLCATRSIPRILEGVKAIAEGQGPNRGQAARMIVVTLLSAGNGSPSCRRLGLFLLLVGIMDGHQGRDSFFSRFLSCYSRPENAAGSKCVGPLALSSSIILRLVVDSSLLARLSPALASMLILFFNLSEGAMSCSVKLGNLRGHERSLPPDISWPLALRMGLFMLQRLNPFHRNNPEVPLAVITCALSDGYRDRWGGIEHRSLVARASAASERLAAAVVLMACEEDPARARLAAPPVQVRFVRPAPATETVLESDGTEFVGYRRDPRSREVTGIERERPREVPRHPRHRCRFRWNNEPVVRARFANATVTPTGLVLFGDDALLEYEFANQVNRSGYAIDPFQLHHHSEVLSSTDHVAALRTFESRHVDSAVLLSGLGNLHNFGHFIINGVFKLSAYNRKFFQDSMIILPTMKHPFQEEILNYCGYPSSSLVFTEKRVGVSTGRLDVFEEAPHGLVAANLAEAFRAELPRPRRCDEPRRIYVARPHNAARPLTNEAAIVERLVARDFQILRPEELPFHEQGSAFETADVIVAPHGSALFNLWFCFGRKRIVEIRTKVATPAARYSLLGHQVMQVPSRAVQAQDGVGGISYEADLTALFQAVEWALDA